VSYFGFKGCWVVGLDPICVGLCLFALLFVDTVSDVRGSITEDSDGVSSFFVCGLVFVVGVTSNCTVLAAVMVDTTLDIGFCTWLGFRAPRSQVISV